MQAGLHATTIHVSRGARCSLQTAVAIGKQQHGVAMHVPEALQGLVCRLRQRNETIPVALGIADVHAPACGIDIPHLQSQSFAQAQPQAIEREEEHPVTQYAGGGEYALRLRDRDDVRQALSPGRLDQTGGHPRLTQDVCVIKLQPVQVKFDRTPGVRCHQLGEVVRQLLLGQAVNLMIKAIPHSADGGCHQLGEVVRQLLLGQAVNLMIKAIPHSADGAGVSLNRFGLQAFEFQVLQMQLVVLFENCVGQCFHLKITAEFVMEQSRAKGVQLYFESKTSPPLPRRSGFVQPSHRVDPLRPAASVGRSWQTLDIPIKR